MADIGLRGSFARTEAFILLLQASSWIMQRCYPYIAAFFAPPETLTELQNDANFPAKGYDIHHIVEKALRLTPMAFPKVFGTRQKTGCASRR